MKKYFVKALQYGLILMVFLLFSFLAYSAATYTGTLDEDQEAGSLIFVKKDGKMKFSMLPDGDTIGFIGTVLLESSKYAGSSFKTVQTFTGTVGSGITTEQTGSFSNDSSRKGLWYRFRMENIDDDNTSSSITYTLTEDFDPTDIKIVSNGARVGATSGWTLATNTGALGQLPDSQTSSTLVVPLDLEVGDIIVSYSLYGQIEGDSGTGIIDVDMRKLAAAAGDLTDVSIGAFTGTLSSVGSDLLINSSNLAVTLGVPEELSDDEVIYVLITGSTLPTSDINIQSVRVNYTKRSLFK